VGIGSTPFLLFPIAEFGYIVTDHNSSLAAHSLNNQAADEDNAKKVA
jgi:hypothetical protein